eukprot:CAMPEP_0176172230 /NCGR_PEP_ID=MMETSP0120_2-20121206/88230_1 /TAXON_ID=160619 /ORGANISM="Kryptoperidinium foliaceum, Strain CCMP 1326" /LENGTH=45 /DNA_ID= /DNA_START= /DNA_END= /DNA_ORIENTATION=
MDGPVVDSLFGLFNEGLTENLPVQILSDSINLLEGLVDWNSPDRD